MLSHINEWERHKATMLDAKPQQNQICTDTFLHRVTLNLLYPLPATIHSRIPVPFLLIRSCSDLALGTVPGLLASEQL